MITRLMLFQIFLMSLLNCFSSVCLLDFISNHLMTVLLSLKIMNAPRLFCILVRPFFSYFLIN